MIDDSAHLGNLHSENDVRKQMESPPDTHRGSAEVGPNTVVFLWQDQHTKENQFLQSVNFHLQSKFTFLSRHHFKSKLTTNVQ